MTKQMERKTNAIAIMCNCKSTFVLYVQWPGFPIDCNSLKPRTLPKAPQVKNFTRPLKFLEAVQVLLNAKALVDAKDENCCTALHRSLVE